MDEFSTPYINTESSIQVTTLQLVGKEILEGEMQIRVWEGVTNKQVLLLNAVEELQT